MPMISRALALVCVVAAVNYVSIDSAQMGTLNNMPAYKEYFGLNATTMGLNVSVLNLGSIFAGLFSGQLVDKWGRKVGMYSAAAVAVIGAIIQGTSTTLAQFMIGRIVLGISSTINTTSVPPYLAEMAPPGKRGFIAGFYWANWLFGSILAASVGLGTFQMKSTWSWRILSLVQMGPGLLCAIIVPFIPESPRWLVGQDRHEEAEAVLARFHAGGDHQSPIVLAQMKEITDTIAIEKAENAVTWKMWLRNFWTHRGNQRRAITLLLLGVFEQTVGSSLITYYLSSVLTLVGITDTKTKLAINLGVTSFAFCSAIAGVCVVDKAGRKKMIYFGSLWCAACLCVMAGLTSSPLKEANTSRQIGVVAMVFLFQFGFSYCAEILNYSIRAKGMAIYHMITSSADFVNQWLIPIGLANITWRFYIIGIVWNVFMCIVIYFVFVETKQLSLEEIDQLFNGLKRNEIVTLDEVVKGGKLDIIDGINYDHEADTSKSPDVATTKIVS